MALKRKETDDSSLIPQKKARVDATEDDCASNNGADYVVNYTDNGTKRAQSEARRQWNYVCSFEDCGQRFNRPCRLDAHMRSHNNERPFACTEPDCDKTFPRKDHLNRHVKNAHGDVEAQRTFLCDWDGCGKSFTSNGRLQRHKDVHASKYHCTEYPPCKEVFRKQQTLQAHVNSQHLHMKPYPCTFVDPDTGEKCTSAFKQEGTMRRHLSRAHMEKEDAGIYCMLCPMSIDPEDAEDDIAEPLEFETKEQLQAHIAEVHPPLCSICGQKFKNNSNLKSHVETVHAAPADQPQYPCPNPDCDSVFNRKHNLTVHVQSVHEKQLKFFCTADALKTSKHNDLKEWDGENACGAAFKAKSSLDQHVRTHHLGLGNRRQQRKAARSKKKPDPSMLTMLTGVGYEQGREVSCLVPTCEFRFFMDRDLRRHLRATHCMTDDEIEEKILERDALTGGQFWIGGIDDSMTNMFDSVEPSMPQTPVPYFADGSSSMPPPPPLSDMHAKLGGGGDPRLNMFGQQFDHLSLMNEEAEMDLAMGLGDVAPATDAHEGLWDVLAPVEQFNHAHE